jgi:hypothetical protein
MSKRPASDLEFKLLGVPLDRSVLDGPVAQLGERLICIQEVSGSIPLRSTILQRIEWEHQTDYLVSGMLTGP